MCGRTPVSLAILACIAACTVGCRGEKGAKITGVVVENGQPVQISAKERVMLSMVPVHKDEKSIKANPGADFKREDATFIFVGPGLGLLPPGDYKVCLTVWSRDTPDRYNGQFSPENTPLTYAVTHESKQEIVIDVEKKSVTRK